MTPNSPFDSESPDDWEHNSQSGAEAEKPVKPDAGKEVSEETYHIPGGLSGWQPGDIPPPRSDGSLRKTPARNDPKEQRASVPRKKRADSHRTWELLGFNLLVFVSSICVMTLELTASRLIAKHVGSSLYTWTSVIGVVLAGITIGNSLGGWLADRYPRDRTLAWMFLLSSIACSSVLWLDQLMGGLPRPDYISWPSWILVVVASIFLVPAVLLGTTSPLVASMALERSTRTGSTVGNVYAWGAFGSIVGTFLTGFFLVDVWGTRAIVGMISATLGILAVLVATRWWVFRTAVVLGWFQLLGFISLAACITRPTSEAVAAGWARAISGGDAEAKAVHLWSDFGNRLGEKLHEIGLLLRLRDDQLGAYHDESSYSYIQVRDDYIDGSPVRALRLDKLDHSYFDPAQPTKLHYEYEEVYAAITRRAAPTSPGDLQATLPNFPGREELVADLPDGVSFDPARERLTISSITPELLDRLLQRSPEAKYWQALERLRQETTKPTWGGFSAVELNHLPDSVTIPESMRYQIRYDEQLRTLTAYEVLKPEVSAQLFALGEQAPWRQAIESFRKETTALSTLFIGGGGFIFPRWILAEFPASKRIDVAELDPAVYLAVKKQMGLTPAEDQRINTVIGDARNFVDDRLRENHALEEAGQPPVQYDFIYGDAFNDFGVPWHLPTQEFARKLSSLLAPEGVFLANIIEIYPRTDVPGGTVPEADAQITSPLPEGLFEPLKPRQPTRLENRIVRSKFGDLAVLPPDRLKYTGPLPTPIEERLLALAPADGDWLVTISQLAERSRSPAPLPVGLPEDLKPAVMFELTWTACPPPFEGVEVYRLDSDQYVVGLRGVVPPVLEQRLMALKPDDARWKELIRAAVARSRQAGPGRFLGRYVNTVSTVFPYVAVFCTTDRQPSEGRDTFVVACAQKPMNLSDMERYAGWEIAPFAEAVRSASGETEYRGQMASLLGLAEGKILTDDFAPVDNLLRAVFEDQDE